jgi:hypothetical protein
MTVSACAEKGVKRTVFVRQGSHVPGQLDCRKGRGKLAWGIGQYLAGEVGKELVSAGHPCCSEHVMEVPVGQGYV